MSPEKRTLDDLKIDRTAPPRNSRGVGVITGLIVILAIGGVAYAWLGRSEVRSVRTLTVQESVGGKQTVLNASGYVTARRQATVSSKVTGKVIEVLIEEGQRVQEGQIVARLDSVNVDANLNLAEAQLDVARSSLAETRALILEAERDWERVAALTRERVASPADSDRSQANLNSLKARLERQQTEVVVAERQVALWQQQKEDTIIRAPFAGVVISKNAQPGEMISPVSAGGGFTRTGICTVVDMASLEVEVDVNESYINRVEPGQRVQSTLDSYADWQIPSKVIAIIPTADRQKATVKVRIGFDQLDPRILPDMGVKVAFQGASEVAATRRDLTIPKSAVRRSEGHDTVLVVRDGRVEQRAVSVGIERDGQVAIRSGLAAGEPIVIEAPAELKAGERVKEQKR